METELGNSIQLLMIKGAQDHNTKQQIVTPNILKIPKSPEQHLCFKSYDLIKIKGFIVLAKELSKLANLLLHAGHLTIAFSFLIEKNTKTYTTGKTEDKCFIEFPHDYFFNHAIPIIKMQYNDFILELVNDSPRRDFDINVVLDTFILDVNERKQLSYETSEVNYNVRNIQKFELYYYNPNPQDNAPQDYAPQDYAPQDYDPYFTYTAFIKPKLINQGLIVNASKNDIISIKIQLNKTFFALDYNSDLVRVYGEEIANNLTYFGFNVCEKFESQNLVGSLNFSRVDIVEVTVVLAKNSYTLDIYLPAWNVFTYNQGLFGIRWCP